LIDTGTVYPLMKLALLISPEAKSAYFKDYLDVATQELSAVLPGMAAQHRQVGALEFLELECEEAVLPTLARLSFVQGMFSIDGPQLTPLVVTTGFTGHEDFVFGSKYKGKTNERLTQLLINLGLAAIGAGSGENVKLLDPMCGRGTTLLWAMRYGIKARGIEQDVKALADVHQSLKKWSKLHRQKHQLREGSIGKADKKGIGKFLEYTTEEGAMKMVIGDARNAYDLYKGEKFDLLVSDLPYGVQHFASDGARNPLAVLEASAMQWEQCLKPGGAIVLAFNTYIPKRRDLVAAFTRAGLTAQPFTAPHRMSESIVRDVVVFRAA
jgi:SAM-dependent methyltransferase